MRIVVFKLRLSPSSLEETLLQITITLSSSETVNTSLIGNID